MNVNYRRGRQKEYRLKKKYEKLGYIVLRTAGSHGFADLIAIEKYQRDIIFIQAKPNNFSENQKRKLNTEFDWVNDVFSVEFVVE